MNTELRKRLEEAAKEIADKKFPKHRASENDRRAREDYQLCRDSCIIGIELGYKEAVAQAKEWLKEHSNTEYYSDGASYCDTPFATQEDMLDDFDFDMNKLWEET